MEVTKSQFTHENTKDGEEHIGRQTEDFGRRRVLRNFSNLHCFRFDDL